MYYLYDVFFVTIFVNSVNAGSLDGHSGAGLPANFAPATSPCAPALQFMNDEFRRRPVRRLSVDGIYILKWLEDAETCIPLPGPPDKDFDDRQRIFTSDLLRCVEGQELKDVCDAASEFARRHWRMTIDILTYLDPLVYSWPKDRGHIGPWLVQAGMLRLDNHWRMLPGVDFLADFGVLTSKDRSSKRIEIPEFKRQIVNEESRWKLPDFIKANGG